MPVSGVSDVSFQQGPCLLDATAAMAFVRMMLKDFRTVWVEGDGNCLWRAIACGLWGSDCYYLQLKLYILTWAAQHLPDSHTDGVNLPASRLYWSEECFQKYIPMVEGKLEYHQADLVSLIQEEIANLCPRGKHAGRLAAYWASSALSMPVKIFNPQDTINFWQWARRRAQEKEPERFVDKRWSREFRPPNALCRSWTLPATEDFRGRFVDEIVIALTKYDPRGAVQRDEEVEQFRKTHRPARISSNMFDGLNHFAVVLPRDGSGRPWPLYRAAPPCNVSAVSAN